MQILEWRCEAGQFPEVISQLTPCIINGVMETYETSITKLLPTPSKSHYTFNLRDVSRVIQGMMLQPSSCLDTDPLVCKKQGVRFF